MKKQKIAVMSVAICAVMLFSIGTSVAWGQKPFVMVTSRPKNSFEGKWLSLIYTEALKRLKLTLVYEVYPSKRCSVLSDDGDVDGDLYRAYSYLEAHPNLRRVEASPFSVFFSAFAIDPKIQLNGWESLKGTKYRVEYRRGIKVSKANLVPIIPKKNLSIVNKIPNGLKRLIAKRTDVYVDVENWVIGMLKSDKFRNSGIRKVGVMEETTTHAFLHKKHQGLVPKLSKVITDMKEQGLIEQYRVQAEAK
ncbi:MAG: hypothetical protein GY795_23110 [Desulfobacterales bacterium]|nr:hypothetical protein [Desulfobacterales bacterium]